MKILVVDDDAMAGEMTGAILEDGGHRVILAEDAMRAIECFDADGDFDMIISDMNMPLIKNVLLF